MEREFLEAVLEEGVSLEEIGRRVGRHPSTVAYWLRKHGLEASNRTRHLARGPLARETLQALVLEGLSLRQIAARLDRSPASVRHWLGKHGLDTQAARALRERGSPGQVGICAKHGPSDFVERPDGVSRCVRCRSEAVSQRRRTVKRILVEEAGGACVRCGYDRCVAALHFHHVDPTEKLSSIGRLGSRSLAAAREEAHKCLLLCSNCHAEVESGLATLA
jgi:transposase